MKRIIAFMALAGATALAGCSYNAESSLLGYRSSISYSTPGMGPPPPPAYGPSSASSCYVPGFYNRWGYWVPPRNRC